MADSEREDTKESESDSEQYDLELDHEFGIIPCHGITPDLKDEPVTDVCVRFKENSKAMRILGRISILPGFAWTFFLTAWKRLFGRNIAQVAEVHGWSHSYAEYYPSLPYTNCNSKGIQAIRQFDPDILGLDGDEQMHDISVQMSRQGRGNNNAMFEEDKVAEMYRKRVPLSQVCSVAVVQHAQKLPSPFFVTVLAKHRLEIAFRDNKALIYGKLIVADETRVCIVKLLNNANQLAYNCINVGDTILICSSSLMQLFQNVDFYPRFGAISLNLNGLLRFTEFDKMYLIKKDGRTNSIANFFVPTYKKLWSPGSLHKLIQTDLIDMIGVVSHVSRFERRRKYEGKVVLGDDSTTVDNFVQFEVTCWIEIVGKSPTRPIPILLHLTSLIWRQREELVPGSLIVVTNVRRILHDVFHIQEEYFNQSFHSTNFSQIYVNSDVEKYWNLMKSDSVDAEIEDFLGNANSSAILKRADVPWSIGGAYPVPIGDPTKFMQLYKTKVLLKQDALNSNPQFFISPRLPLHRRESKLLIFQGVLLRYDLCTTNNERGADEPWTWTRETAFERHQIKRRNIEKIFVPYPANTSSPFLWFFWRRKFPEFKIEKVRDVNFKKKIKQYETAENDFKHFTEAISMPVRVGKKLKKLKVMDGAPHVAVDILNKEETDPDLKRFVMTWKPSIALSALQIEDKLQQLRDHDTVLVVAKIHRIESIGIEDNLGYDLMIHDILPLPFVN